MKQIIPGIQHSLNLGFLERFGCFQGVIVSGKDRSYLVLESDQPMSRGALQKLLNQAGLEAMNIESRDDAPDRRTYLVEVDHYVAPDDPRLDRLLRGGEEAVGQCRVIGGYAVPLSAAELESVAERESDQDSG